jgi:pterin-4a-carbinolamine dehydratase
MFARHFMASTAIVRGPSSQPASASAIDALTSTHRWILRSKQTGKDGECVPCGGSADDKSNELVKEFKFRNFKEAFAFMGLVAETADRMNVRSNACSIAMS